MNELIQRLSEFQSRLLMVIHGIPWADLLRPESEARWSIANVIAHLGDVEFLTAMRMRLILIENEPELAPFEQKAWVE